MEVNDPLDTLDFSANVLTAKEVITLLQQHGFPEVYETVQGSIEIKGQSSLKCQVTKNPDNYWVPHVSTEWLSTYVVIPAVAFSMLVKFLGFGGFPVSAISAMVGLGIGSLLLENKKRKTLQRLEEALYE